MNSPMNVITSTISQVSHHPNILELYAEGRGWQVWAETYVKSKFWGRSIDINPVGEIRLQFADGELFTWTKASTLF